MNQRFINASIKRAFRNHTAFVPCKAQWIGSFPSIRFEADLPISLLQAVARHVETEFTDWTRPHGKPTQRLFGFIEGGSIINWLTT